jgi:hypothetical protein
MQNGPARHTREGDVDFISLKPDEIFGPGNAAIAAFLICNLAGFLFRGWWKGCYSIALGMLIAEVIVLRGVAMGPQHGVLAWSVGVLNGFLAVVAAGIVSKVTAKVDTARAAVGRPMAGLVHDWFDF